MNIDDRAHRTRKRQANLDSVSQQLASHYGSLAAGLSSPDSAVYGRENQAQNQSASQ